MPRRPRVVIAGGGAAAIEAMIAMRELMDGFVGIDMVTPESAFVYRPLLVAEPFGLSERVSFDLGEIAADHAAELHVGPVEVVDPDEKVVKMEGGPVLPYDSLLVATGARTEPWLDGAIHFGGPDQVNAMRELVGELDEGQLASVVFAAAPGSRWTLPLYELALLTASRAGERRSDLELTIVTPENEPLGEFGPSASAHIRELCSDRGIRLHTATRASSWLHGRVQLSTGTELEADRVVALPDLAGNPIGGLPCDRDGFIPVDEYCAVRGIADVFAAGDGIDYPIKQGGLATQQADVAAAMIAAQLGEAITPQPFRPLLRGQLLTGLAPVYMSASPEGGEPPGESLAPNPLWWPPSKIAGRYLAPYLANLITPGGVTELEQREPIVAARAETREEARQLALTFAEQDARHRHFDSAIGWLEVLEQLDGVLAPPLAKKRDEWRSLSGERGDG